MRRSRFSLRRHSRGWPYPIEVSRAAMSDRNQISEQGALAGSPRRNGVLNARQQKFVLEYQIDQVATQAATRAGYSAGTAHVQGSRLLSNVKVREAIAKTQAKAAGNAEVTIERVLKEYARIAFLDPRDFYDADGRLLNIKDMPEDAARAIAGLEEEVIYGSDSDGGKVDIGRLKKIRLTGKIPALEGLARHLGMFTDDRAGFAQQFAITIHVGREE